MKGGLPPLTSDLPQIIDEPLGRTLSEGHDVSLTISVLSGTPVNFQWQRNGTNIEGAIDPTLLVRNARVADAGDYQVNVSNSSGSVKSILAKVEVTPAPLTPGSLDLSLNTSAGPNGPVYACDLQADGQILVAGDFTRVNGLTRNQFAKLRFDGTVDPSFDPTIAGSFTTVNGIPRNNVARLLLRGQVP